MAVPVTVVVVTAVAVMAVGKKVAVMVTVPVKPQWQNDAQ